jgi:hypothetical protein
VAAARHVSGGGHADEEGAASAQEVDFVHLRQRPHTKIPNVTPSRVPSFTIVDTEHTSRHRSVFYVSSDVRDRMIALAAKNDRSLSAEVRVALREHLDREERDPRNEVRG